MAIIKLTQRERALAGYLVDSNKSALNRISKDCVSPLIAIRQTVKASAEAIGRTALKSEESLTHDEFMHITRWINDVFFK